MAIALRTRDGRTPTPTPAEEPAGLTVLIPGYPQWAWRQTERAAALGGTYAAAMAVAVFAWGSPMGLAMLALAFVVHAASAADVIRQGAFPGFGRFVPAASASFGLGLGCYAPALALASVIAWPQGPSGAEHERYAINLWAFRSVDPEPGDWVWYELPEGRGYGLGRVVAGQGRSVEWSPGALTIDGKPLGWSPKVADDAPADLAMIVPEGQVLIVPKATLAGSTPSCGLKLVARDKVIGRPWARLFPISGRGLLL